MKDREKNRIVDIQEKFQNEIMVIRESLTFSKDLNFQTCFFSKLFEDEVLTLFFQIFHFVW